VSRFVRRLGPLSGPLSGKDAFVPLTAENSTRPSSSARSFSQRSEIGSSASGNRFWLSVLLGAVAIFATYSNHFQNSFHFDDSHTVIDNVFIRDLHNIPRFFTDATTFSSLPANQTWRPFVSVTLAIDYALGHGLNPLWFHIDTFIWFGLQLILMFYLYRRLMDADEPRPANAFIALFAVLWYGLHPAIAETVNYVMQRADLHSTLGVVAGLLIYIRWPDLRKFGIYLVPVALGAFSKAPAVLFCGILFVYLFLFEEDADWTRLWRVLVRSTPAIIVCGMLAVLCSKMTSKTFTPTDLKSSTYWLAQPLVLARYVRSFFLPFWLSADTDLRPVYSFTELRCLFGIFFCLVLLAIGLLCIKRRELRPIAFGIFWFFIASSITSIFVLAEVENDHRMFFPFVGLTLSVVWAVALLVYRLFDQVPEKRRTILRAIKIVSPCLLLAYGFGTFRRNAVWHTEESLWRDVTEKSPQNGRGLMNYGLALMGKGNLQGALSYFQRATEYTPNYFTLEINTGIALGALNRSQEAEPHFRRAIVLAPPDAQPYYYYGRWLKQQGRIPESITALKSAITRNPPWIEPRYLLMQIYQDQGQAGPLHDLAQDTLRLSPGDAAAQRYLASSRNLDPPLTVAEKIAAAQPSPEHYLNLSLLYYQAGRFQDCIDSAHKALKLKPDYAEAYNNVAAAYQSLQQWDSAIDAAQHALRINPNLTLARNNLAWSQSQKKLQAQKR
jgi:protein O-mannosyl-transferase